MINKYYSGIMSRRQGEKNLSENIYKNQMQVE